MTATGTRRVILVVNPCHVTPPEHAFWKAVAGAAAKRGWTLVQIATRLLPDTEKAWTISLPARLSDLEHRLQSVPLWRPSWLPAEHLPILEDWEYRRWQIDRRLPAVLSGLMRLASYVEEVLSELRPAVVLTLNKIDHPVDLFRRAALAHGIPTAVVERSPLDGIWLEPDGLFAESKIWQSYSPSLEQRPAAAATGFQGLESLRSNPGSFRSTSGGGSSTQRWLLELPRPLVFLPMDNVLWTGWEQPFHPMAPVDNPLYPDPYTAMATVAAHVSRLGGTLLVKKHPACLAITEATVPPEARFVEGELGTLLEESDVVTVFNTKVAFPALALGKPVVTLAPNPVARSGATYHATSPSEVSETLAAAVRQEALEEKVARFPPFVQWLEESYFYRCEEARRGGEKESRGPDRFCAEVVESAREPREDLSESEREALAPRLYARASPPPPAGSRRKGGVVPAAPTVALTTGRSLVGKSLATLRAGGPRELGRKCMIRVLSWSKGRRLKRVIDSLERRGVELREFKARNPYLVSYRSDWREPREGEGPVFDEAWARGLPTPSHLHPTGCSPEALELLRAVRGRHSGESLWILLEPVDGRVPPTARTLVTTAESLSSHPSADFFCTLDLVEVRKLSSVRASRRTEIWLPQVSFGLLPPDRDVHWFGTAPPAVSLVEDLSDTGVVAGGSVVASVHVAAHLGFRDVTVFGPHEEVVRQRLRGLTRGGKMALRFDERSKGAMAVG